MISFLAKYFIKDKANLASESVRGAYGVLCGIVGIVLNLCLFLLKIAAGTLSGSIAITADAFNNLSDAGSSVITLLGFRLSAKKPDEDHPFGHGRSEYIAGLIVSMLIIIVGVELVQSSYGKIVSPSTDTSFGILPLIILILSILIKLYMAYYNKSVGKKIGSAALKATATDSLSDSIATSVVLICTLITKFTSVNIDGYCGLAVALFIIYAGINAAKETINPLLGQMPSREFVEKIEALVLSYDQVTGIHDLIVHDYGPGRVMISLHAEVSDKADLLATHDIIDNIERELKETLGCAAVIHMDPIASDDEETNQLRESILSLVKTFDERLSIHDFRMVKGDTHTNLIFDIVLPHDMLLTEDEIKKKLSELIRKELSGTYYTVITVDRQMA